MSDDNTVPRSILAPLQGVTVDEAHDVVRRLEAAIEARRNCWTCAHDETRRTAGGMEFHVCGCAQAEGVVDWIEQHVAPPSPDVPPSMPPRDAPPCPAWSLRRGDS